MSRSKILKIGVGACIFMALFFSYQIPYGIYQTGFKTVFLGLAILLSFAIMTLNGEAKNRKLNFGVILFLAVTLFLYFFETE